MSKKLSKEEIESAISNAAGVLNEQFPEETKKQEQEPKKTSDQDKIKELTDTLQRVQADFINYKNRSDREKLICVDYGNAELIKRLLPIIDSFELALKNSQDPQKFKKGMEMIYHQFASMLKDQGVKKIDALDKKFDPYMHEVLMKAHSDKEEDTIVEEFQKGYMLKDKVLRHTKVKISAGKAEEKKNTESKDKTSNNNQNKNSEDITENIEG